MKKMAMAVLLGALLVAVAAGMAAAQSTQVEQPPSEGQTINCTGGTCQGTKRADTINEDPNPSTDAEDDLVVAKKGGDEINMNRTARPDDVDVVYANKGNDEINTQDGDVEDTVYCGRGFDTAIINEGEKTRNCEVVDDGIQNGS